MECGFFCSAILQRPEGGKRRENEEGETSEGLSFYSTPGGRRRTNPQQDHYNRSAAQLIHRTTVSGQESADIVYKPKRYSDPGTAVFRLLFPGKKVPVRMTHGIPATMKGKTRGFELTDEEP